MGLDNLFNKREIELISKTTKIENRVYNKDELRIIKSNIIDDILSKSSKNGDIQKANEEFCDILEKIDPDRPKLDKQEKEEVEIQIKYEGYIKMQEAQVERFKKLETKILPEDISYEEIKGISLEGRQKLDKFKPYSIGQASRISGVSPADISVLLVYLEQKKKERR